MFLEKYKLTTGGFPEPKFRRYATAAPWNTLEAGLYNDGLVGIFDKDFDQSFLKSWEWLLGKNVVLLSYTCWGDFFYVDASDSKFYFVIPNDYKRIHCGNSLRAVFDSNLAYDDFINVDLRPDDFSAFQEELGPLEYGKIYVTRASNERVIRTLSVFLDIAGQTGEQLRNIPNQNIGSVKVNINNGGD